MKDFFKSKFNIALFIVQALALLFLCLCNVHGIFLILAIVLEGVFFILYGVSFFLLNKKNEKDKTLFEMLPVSEEEKKMFVEKQGKSKKQNILKGIMFIIFGIVLVFLIVFQ